MVVEKINSLPPLNTNLYKSLPENMELNKTSVNKVFLFKTEMSSLWTSLNKLNEYPHKQPNDYITIDVKRPYSFGTLNKLEFNDVGGLFDIKQEIYNVNVSEKFIQYKILNPPIPIIEMFSSFLLKKDNNHTKITWVIQFKTSNQYSKQLSCAINKMFENNIKHLNKMADEKKRN